MDMEALTSRLSWSLFLVNGPRLVIVFLLADIIHLPREIEGLLLFVTAVATAITLAAGGLSIMHVLSYPLPSTIGKMFITACWIALLVSMVILLAPLTVVRLRDSELGQVLSPEGQWLWAITAIISVEIVAAGAMVASGLLSRLQNRSLGDSLSGMLSRFDRRDGQGQYDPHSGIHTNNTSRTRERDRL
jgi:hypothetical protein